eukprot:79965_1
MYTRLTQAEREPLIGTDHPRQPQLSKPIRPYRVKPIWCLIALLILTAIIIFALPKQHRDHQSVQWISMEQAHSRKTHIPSTWALKQECDDDHAFIITLALKQQNTDKLDSHIAEVSDPSNSATFHQYWTPEQVRSYFKPSEETLQSVLDWLESNGFTTDNDKVQLATPHGNSIKVSLTCSEGNALLNAKYMIYENNEDKRTHLRVQNGEYSIPDTVYEHIDFISPTIRFPLRHHTYEATKVTDEETNCEDFECPSVLFDMYQMTDTVADILGSAGDLDTSTCRQSVLSLIGQYYEDSDLEMFWTQFDVNPQSTMQRVPSSQPEGYGAEAELDSQYITGMGTGIYTYVYYLAEETDPFIGLTQSILDTTLPPLVVSISYGEEEYDLGLEYATRANEEIGKLALIGTTVLASSGDEGVRGDGSDCYDGDTYTASFPASSPYVTAVGGTQDGTIPASVDVSTEEVAWVNSGGGFSEYFSTPSWQQSAVQAYFSQDDITFPSSSRYDAQGRGYPDISAQSVGYLIVIKETVYSVSGTSASSPTVAGMISMINYARIQNGKASLGFLNPVLYGSVYGEQNGDFNYYFNDVTSGYNLGCSVDNNIGFYTAQGWDPVTGCGTPKFGRLYDVLFAI